MGQIIIPTHEFIASRIPCDFSLPVWVSDNNHSAITFIHVISCWLGDEAVRGWCYLGQARSDGIPVPLECFRDMFSLCYANAICRRLAARTIRQNNGAMLACDVMSPFIVKLAFSSITSDTPDVVAVPTVGVIEMSVTISYGLRSDF